MYDTPSLFESLEADQTHQRVASRRALALADTRVADKMGQFLRGARNEEEFLARLGLVQEDFDWLVHSASEEVGYEHPEYIKKTIIASYHVSEKVNFAETPAEEEEEQEAQKEAHTAGMERSANPGMPSPTTGQPQTQPQIAPSVTPFTGPSANPVEANPAAMHNPQAANPLGAPGQDPNQIEQAMDPMMHQQPQYTGSWRVVGESGNTDLGGPEPKIDKAHKFPKKDVLGDEDKGRWPTKQKDVTKPIERKNRSEEGHDPKEIGEKTTETVDLPAAKGDDSGFADGGVTKQDGPGTWHGNGGQTDPVTHEKQSSLPSRSY